MRTTLQPGEASQMWTAYQQSLDLTKVMQTLERSSADDQENLEQLSERIRPAALVQETLYEVDTSKRTSLTNCFLEGVKTGKSLDGYTLQGKYITLHRFPSGDGDYFAWFRPTVGEVLAQLPETLQQTNQHYYYTTQKVEVPNSPESIRGGDVTFYDVAVTFVFGSENNQTV